MFLSSINVTLGFEGFKPDISDFDWMAPKRAVVRLFFLHPRKRLGRNEYIRL